ncbi:MAG: hypothetical protein PHY74_07475 [Candidatus Bathyarchaeota archaeon]|nr:hypothetical protein [Candidatus Bathyarchaeota archaeon]
MKQISAALLIVVLMLLTALSYASFYDTVSAQTNDYKIEKIDHQIFVMYSGNVAVIDTIQITGQITDNFKIGLPYLYSSDILKVIAYDEKTIYNVELGVQLGDRSGFYGAEIDFQGDSPEKFTVVFVLSNSLITEQGNNRFSIDFPAYPSLTRDVGTCNVAVSFPASPTELVIIKDDRTVNDKNYLKTGLPAYTYSIATAIATMPDETLKLLTINELNRQINIDVIGTVTVNENYRITSNTATVLNKFALNLPLEAMNVVVRDQSGGVLDTEQAPSAAKNILFVDVTLPDVVSKDETTVVTAQYNLPSATIQDSKYVLDEFQVYPKLQYLIEQFTITFNPPEGAIIITPQPNTLGRSSTLTRTVYQDILTIKEENISYVDYLTPNQDFIEVRYEYNPVWASFKPTFWASVAAAIGCIGAVIYQQYKSKQKSYKTGKGQLFNKQPLQSTLKREKIKQQEIIKTGQNITSDTIKEFVDSYEDKRQLNTELSTLEALAQKGKIPRRQYKAQKKAIEDRIENLEKKIETAKAIFRGSTGQYPDLIRQLDAAELDKTEAEENIKILDTCLSKGEISIETYKRNIVDYQKLRNKAESAINGILMRLREKIR